MPGKCCLALLEVLGGTVVHEKRRKLEDPALPAQNLGDSQHFTMGSVVQESAITSFTIGLRLETEREQNQIQAAVKMDNAPIPCYLWDGCLLPHLPVEQRSNILTPI
jgi:hypothetical protein